MKNSNIIYLFQGEANRLKSFFPLKKRNEVDTLFLSYDKKIDGAFFLPDSTWAEGRNYLLEKAIEMNNSYYYFIFIDDDVSFLKGDFVKFEKALIKKKPAVGVPVFVPKTYNTIIFKNKKKEPLFQSQICCHADAQFIALHKDLIFDKIVVPLQTQFDSISWWCTSSTQQLLLFNLYKKYFIQFNHIQVTNDCHREYTNQPFFEIQGNWFKKEFRKKIIDPRKYCQNIFSYPFTFKDFKNNSLKEIYLNISKSTITLLLTIFYSPKKSYQIKKGKIKNIFKKTSQLKKQFLNK
ncbi:MAG: hypothetical protein K9H26_10120 [Prolixibacteraceae bacterium]|nr:hypothetical protein [Prolixibacteraceae bacterium]